MPKIIQPDIFDELTTSLPATRVAQAYIRGVFTQQIHTPADYSRESLVFAYAAIDAMDLAARMKLADYILWRMSWFPPREHRNIVLMIGQMAYARCYRLVPKWRLLEELADCLEVYTAHVHHHLDKTKLARQR